MTRHGLSFVASLVLALAASLALAAAFGSSLFRAVEASAGAQCAMSGSTLTCQNAKALSEHIFKDEREARGCWLKCDAFVVPQKPTAAATTKTSTASRQVCTCSEDNVFVRFDYKPASAQGQGELCPTFAGLALLRQANPANAAQIVGGVIDLCKTKANCTCMASADVPVVDLQQKSTVYSCNVVKRTPQPSSASKNNKPGKPRYFCQGVEVLRNWVEYKLVSQHRPACLLRRKVGNVWTCAGMRVTNASEIVPRGGRRHLGHKHGREHGHEHKPKLHSESKQDSKLPPKSGVEGRHTGFADTDALIVARG